MKAIITILIVFLFVSGSIAQTKHFKSRSSNSYKQTTVKEVLERDITISNEAIIIPKLWNGNTEDAEFRVERIEKKEHLLELSTWYYCVETKESISLEDSDKRVHRKTVVIVPESFDTEPTPAGLIHIYNFASEVVVYHYVLSIY